VRLASLSIAEDALSGRRCYFSDSRQVGTEAAIEESRKVCKRARCSEENLFLLFNFLKKNILNVCCSLVYIVLIFTSSHHLTLQVQGFFPRSPRLH
jgi:uncharacterized membrane protein